MCSLWLSSPVAFLCHPSEKTQPIVQLLSATNHFICPFHLNHLPGPQAAEEGYMSLPDHLWTMSPCHESVEMDLWHWWEKKYTHLCPHCSFNAGLSLGNPGRCSNWCRLNTMGECWMPLCVPRHFWPHLKGLSGFVFVMLSFHPSGSQSQWSPDTIAHCLCRQCPWHSDLA